MKKVVITTDGAEDRIMAAAEIAELKAAQDAEAVQRQPAPIRVITPIALINRLGEAYPVVLVKAAEALRAEPPNATWQAMVNRITAARVIELDNAELIQGIDAMIAQGWIASEQRAELLSDGRPDEKAA